MLQALDFCHSQGIMHRDVKPHNVSCSPAARTLFAVSSGCPVSKKVCDMPCDGMVLHHPGDDRPRAEEAAVDRLGAGGVLPSWQRVRITEGVDCDISTGRAVQLHLSPSHSCMFTHRSVSRACLYVSVSILAADCIETACRLSDAHFASAC